MNDKTTDYQEFTTKDTPLDERIRLNVGHIWSNSAKCKKCGDIIRSRNRHDMVYCKCKAIAVDGGSEYARRVGDINAIEDMIEYYNGVHDISEIQ